MLIFKILDTTINLCVLQLLHVTVNVTVKILEKGRLYEQEKISLGTCSNSIALEAMLLSTSGFL